MPVFWSGASMLVGRIRLFPVVFLLTVVLPWLKPEMERESTAAISFNKPLVVPPYLALKACRCADDVEVLGRHVLLNHGGVEA
jgi:hypothetical protein